mgnify:FL=1
MAEDLLNIMEKLLTAAELFHSLHSSARDLTVTSMLSVVVTKNRSNISANMSTREMIEQ